MPSRAAGMESNAYTSHRCHHQIINWLVMRRTERHRQFSLEAEGETPAGGADGAPADADVNPYQVYSSHLMNQVNKMTKQGSM